MIFLLALALATATSAAVTGWWRRLSPRESARLGMAIALAFAGASHLFLAAPFIQHLPPWVPLRAEIVLVSGLVEIALGIVLLLPPPTRRRVGVVLALYFLGVFPGNVYVAVFDVEVDGQPGGAYPWVRLPLQLLFIAWALWCTREASPSCPMAKPSRSAVFDSRRRPSPRRTSPSASSTPSGSARTSGGVVPRWPTASRGLPRAGSPPRSFGRTRSGVTSSDTELVCQLAPIRVATQPRGSGMTQS